MNGRAMVGGRARAGQLAVAILLAFAAIAHAQPQEPASAGDADGISLEARLRWRAVGPVLLDADNRLRFPDVGNAPGIYRFDLDGKGGRALYIGETENLRRRFYQYGTPGSRQPTNHRICAEIRRTLASGGTVAVSIVGEAWLCAAAGCGKADLASANQRRLLEQAAIFAAPPGVRVLNSERSGGSPNDDGKMFLFCS